MMTEQQKLVLQMLQDGKLTAEEAERLLAALNPPGDAPRTGPARAPEPPRGERGGTKVAVRTRSVSLLANVDLTGVDLSGTTLDGAHLAGASLSGANLHG